MLNSTSSTLAVKGTSSNATLELFAGPSLGLDESTASPPTLQPDCTTFAFMDTCHCPAHERNRLWIEKYHTIWRWIEWHEQYPDPETQDSIWIRALTRRPGQGRIAIDRSVSDEYGGPIIVLDLGGDEAEADQVGSMVLDSGGEVEGVEGVEGAAIERDGVNEDRVERDELVRDAIDVDEMETDEDEMGVVPLLEEMRAGII